MNKETITVTILPGGKKAKEVNPVNKPIPYVHPMDSRIVQEVAIDYIKRFDNWQSAEDKLRTFDIDLEDFVKNAALETGINSENIIFKDAQLKEGQVFEAQIINETKIRII